LVCLESSWLFSSSSGVGNVEGPGSFEVGGGSSISDDS
jgi:hypothetical protein